MKVAISIVLLFLLVNSFSQDNLVESELVLTKKERRFDKRFVHPKSVFIRYSAGATINKMRFSKENEYFNRSLKNLNFRNFSLEAEIGTKNDFFYELGAKYREYRYAYLVKNIVYHEQHPQYFDGFLIYGGYGKRISLKRTNLNIINVQAGLSLFINRNNYDLYNITDFAPISDETNSEIKAFEIVNQSRIIPTIYIELSKDIRIYKRFYLSLNYRYDQGFISSYKQKFETYSNSNPNEVTTIYNHFRGTAHGFSIGFKHRFLPKKNREE